MNDTLSPEASATIIAREAAESTAASITTEMPQRSTKRRDDPSRCHHRYPNGRRCAHPGLPAKSGLCLRHYNCQVAAGLPLAPVPDDLSDLSEDLLYDQLEFSSAEDLCEYLSRLLTATTKGRVSPRRASVLAYITTQLLHTHVASEKDADNQPIIFDLPRPKRDDDISPEPAMVNSMAARCVTTPVEPDGYDGYTSIPDNSK